MSKKEEVVKTIKGPKWVKPAKQWCTTIFKQNTKGKTQEQNWFSTKEEAEEFINKFYEDFDHDAI